MYVYINVGCVYIPLITTVNSMLFIRSPSHLVQKTTLPVFLPVDRTWTLPENGEGGSLWPLRERRAAEPPAENICMRAHFHLICVRARARLSRNGVLASRAPLMVIISKVELG